VLFRSEIQRLIQYPDRRIKPIVSTMVSSGIRIGAWDYLRWKHVLPMTNDKGEMVVSKLIIYGATCPKKLKSSGIKRLLERALREQHVRQPLQNGAKRHEWKAAHGFRKFYKSRAEQVMKPIKQTDRTGSHGRLPKNCSVAFN